MTNVLLAGETWITHMTDIKGIDAMEMVKYDDESEYLSEPLEKNGIQLNHIPNPTANFEFPTEKGELEEYDVIVLSDISANTMLLHPDTYFESSTTPNRLKLIKKYVKDGGGFAMIGGYFSYQGFGMKGFYHDTPIEEILPVSIYPYDDRKEVPEGINPKVENPNHPILAGISEKWPVFLGYNKLQLKEKGEVLLKAGEDPFLSVGNFGEGRTMAFASDLAPHWASPSFIEWKDRDSFLAQAMNWLAKAQ